MCKPQSSTMSYWFTIQNARENCSRMFSPALVLKMSSPPWVRENIFSWVLAFSDEMQILPSTLPTLFSFPLTTPHTPESKCLEEKAIFKGLVQKSWSHGLFRSTDRWFPSVIVTQIPCMPSNRWAVCRGLLIGILGKPIHSGGGGVHNISEQFSCKWAGLGNLHCP